MLPLAQSRHMHAIEAIARSSLQNACPDLAGHAPGDDNSLFRGCSPEPSTPICMVWNC